MINNGFNEKPGQRDAYNNFLILTPNPFVAPRKNLLLYASGITATFEPENFYMCLSHAVSIDIHRIHKYN
jgi:hypothetical protein